MKLFVGFLQKQQTQMRDNVFKQNGTDFGYNRNYKDWIHKSKQTAQAVSRSQTRMMQQEMQKSPAIKIVKHVVTTLAPKTFQMQLLKMKIHMQTLIGNVFGFQFKTLEANQTKLTDVQADLARARGWSTPHSRN